MPRIAGGAALSGIGFTIALFIVGLAIEDPETQDLARVGVLAASVIAFLLGWVIFGVGDRLRPPDGRRRQARAPVRPAARPLPRPTRRPATDRRVRRLRVPVLQPGHGFDRRGRGALRRRRVLGVPAPAARVVHPHAKEAAQASEAAALQGRFLDMARTLFANQETWRPTTCRCARDLGLDMDRFTEDLRSPAVMRRVEDDQLDAELMDLHGTPTFFIGERRHKGPYDSGTLIKALEAERERADEESPRVCRLTTAASSRPRRARACRTDRCGCRRSRRASRRSAGPS